MSKPARKRFINITSERFIMTKKPTSKPLPQPTDLQAQETIVNELRQKLVELESVVKVETKGAEVERDGFDRYAIGAGLKLQSLARDGIKPERQATFANWQKTRLAELHRQRDELKAELRPVAEQLQVLQNEWRSANAEQLLADAQKRADALRQTIAARQQAQHDLRQRIAQINSVRVERVELQAAFDRAAGVALAAGQPMPPAPDLPEQPAESVPAIEHALGLIDGEIDELQHQRQLVEGEVQALRGLIAKRAVGELMALIEGEAAKRGVSLADLRDELVGKVGQNWLAQLDADQLHAARRELESLRPEVEQLRVDNQTLRNGVAELTSRRFG